MDERSLHLFLAGIQVAFQTKQIPVIRPTMHGWENADAILNGLRLSGSQCLDPGQADSLGVRVLPGKRSAEPDTVEYLLWIRVEPKLVIDTADGIGTVDGTGRPRRTHYTTTGLVVDVTFCAPESLGTLLSARRWIQRDVLWPIEEHISVTAQGERVGMAAMEIAHQELGLLSHSQHFGRIEN